MNLKQLINKGVEAVSGVYPEREAREMVFAFLEHSIGTRRHTHIVEPEYQVKDADASVAMAAFERMASGEPLQYVTGVADFYGRQFRVTPAVLIPRPETELLCREVLANRTNCQMLQWPPLPMRGCENAISTSLVTRTSIDEVNSNGCQMLDPMSESVRILDLCTGSGCIAWTLALEMSGAEVTAVDISDGALEVASSQDFSEEIARTGALSPVFVKADVLAGPSESGLAGQYDVLVSNPPYVMDKEKAVMRPNVLEHEPHLALFVPDDDPLVFYRAISRWALSLLKPDGFGIVEINEALGPKTAELFRGAGMRDVRVIRDLSERDRFVSFRR